MKIDQFPINTKALDGNNNFFSNSLQVWFRNLGYLLTKATFITTSQLDQNTTMDWVQFGPIVFFCINGSTGPYSFTLPRSSIIDSRINENTIIQGPSITGEGDCMGFYFTK